MLKNNIVLQRIVILFLLFCLWVGFTFLYIFRFDTSLTVLSYNHGRESFNNISNKKLLKGDKLSGEFKAKENNLGIISVRFKTFIRPPYKNEDNLTFRIKEAGATNWYYQNNYRDGLIYDVPFFPFGFPKISDSQGKTYYFEIESLKGHTDNSVALSDRGQIFFSRYQIEKSILLHDKKELIVFAVKKIVSALLTTDIRFSSFIYFLPLVFYLLVISSSVIRNKKGIITDFVGLFVSKFYLILLSIVVLDIFIIQLTNDMVYLVILFLWIAVLNISKIDNKMTFRVVFLLLFFAAICLLTKDSQTAEKGAVWAYIILVAGFIQLLVEMKKSHKLAINNGKKIRTTK